MTPNDLQSYLSALLQKDLKMSVMIWGPPGIGKSSIVAQLAQEHGLVLIDLRLSQLAPTDLRGLPVAENQVATWYPPEFLPTEGRGILFLDELNLAPPAMQGMAQQLILDRKVGRYRVPDGWFIWAAGNRKEDRASVFDMPAPLANRFLHLEILPELDSFKQYALTGIIHEQILAFLSFRSELLHKPDHQNPAWPSPRSWEMASKLHEAGIPVAPAVGQAAAAEFTAFIRLYENLPDLEAILRNAASAQVFPEEASVRYATVIGLVVRTQTPEHGRNAFNWLTEQAGAEWVQLFATDLFRAFRVSGKMGLLAQTLTQEPRLQQYFKTYSAMAIG